MSRIYALFVISLMALPFTTPAHALGVIDGCAPEFSIKGSHGGHNSRAWGNRFEDNNNWSVSVGVKFKLGLGDTCKRLNEARISTQRGRADQEQTEAFDDKVQLCRQFTSETAPHSVKEFCGDLITARGY